MREFWLEPRTNLPEEELRKLVENSRPDVILLSKADPTIRTRVASRQLGAEVFVTADSLAAEEARKSGAKIAFEITIRQHEDHERALKLMRLAPDYLLIHCPDWKVIPLENLIAEAKGHSKLIARTSSFEESRLALATLEIGVDGVALSSQDPKEIEKTRELLSESHPGVRMSEATVTRVEALGTGSRVCVDTVDIIGSNEGLLTGCSSQALFLVEAEIHANPHVNPRPFRVNAGPVSLYVLTPEGRTRYLSELSAGEKVLLVDQEGNARPVDVARVKIERRPMLLVEAQAEGRSVKTILQNAETVRLVTPDGSRSVSELKPNDLVLVRLEEGGRHFGTRIREEMIVER
jgi:3-dehydroquinate synthase II